MSPGGQKKRRLASIVVVTRLDRLARSTKDLLELAEILNGIGAGLRSLAEPWADTTSPAGLMILSKADGRGHRPAAM